MNLFLQIVFVGLMITTGLLIGSMKLRDWVYPFRWAIVMYDRKVYRQSREFHIERDVFSHKSMWTRGPGGEA